ncbi:MAG: thiamine pyrophosphate enzyme binding domain protein [Firmicutes bacterium]|nr:thiamine pyrophosphate enzyme binding domain protein [Bacillota bacterium]
MKLSDYVMQFLADKGVKNVFMLPGGGCMHLADSLGKNKDLEYVCCLHEQAAAIAAESYAQHTNDLGAVLVTTGPGGTNAITGLTAAWIDSTPVMFISGQVKRSDLMGTSGVRQMGPQEVNIVPIVESVTKYAETVMEPQNIKYVLEKAYHFAMTGRKGPVWIDVPLDVQAAEIDVDTLQGFGVENEKTVVSGESICKITEMIKTAKRPLILAGNGIKLANAVDIFKVFADKTQIPVLLTWKSIDMLSDDYPNYFGCPGGMGHRYANFILQNADLLIVLGSRLDCSLTAFNHENFAPKARKVMVDIDHTEIDKMQMSIEVKIIADIKIVLEELNEKSYEIDVNVNREWLTYCRKVKEKYPVVLPEYYEDQEYVNAYAFVDELCKQLTEEDIIVPESSGGAGEITYQALRIKLGQKVKNAAGLGSMGFGVPYALGACFANDKKRTILINGDGAFQLNIQELATIAQHNLPIKIFIWNNNGYASIMSTQRNFFEGNYVASNEDSKLYLPNISKVAEAYGFKTFQLDKSADLKFTITTVLNTEGPVLCEIKVSPDQITSPRVKAMKLPNGNMISKSLEDMWPYLDEKEIRGNML